MKAMVFAAGLGTRLRPLTEHCPKALVEVGGMTLLERTLRRLQIAGVTETMINIHHFPDLMLEVTGRLEIPGMALHISDERNQLLDTGGGLLKAAWFFEGGEPFFVCNVDILTNLDLRQLAISHKASRALATLAVKHRETSRYLIFNPQMELCGWENRKTGEKRWARNCGLHAEALAFSGIQVVNPEILRKTRLSGVFSMIDLYLEIAVENKILGWLDDESLVMDVGKTAELAEAEKLIRQGILS